MPKFKEPMRLVARDGVILDDIYTARIWCKDLTKTSFIHTLVKGRRLKPPGFFYMCTERVMKQVDLTGYGLYTDKECIAVVCRQVSTESQEAFETLCRAYRTEIEGKLLKLTNFDVTKNPTS